MKLKQLEGLLGSLEQFSHPKAENSFGDIGDKVVADFGCGCGTLGLAAALLGAEHVIGVDIDVESLAVASANAEDLEVDMEFVQCDVRNFGWRGQIIDTVVMNPPFGTRRKGADMDFLSVALKVIIDCSVCLMPVNGFAQCYLNHLFGRLLLKQFIHCTRPVREIKGNVDDMNGKWREIQIMHGFVE
uniref:Methyltransferase-like protein 5 n=1 Tax=Daucus carota subsp. sativus TaxID=79200 RepID=A0A162AMK9_DAUCS